MPFKPTVILDDTNPPHILIASGTPTAGEVLMLLDGSAIPLMPQSALATGAVDHELPVAPIYSAILPMACFIPGTGQRRIGDRVGV